jgi:hypothetical protein
LGLQLFKKGNIPKNYFIGKYPLYHILTLKKKSWGILDFIFGFSGAIDFAKTDIDDFRSYYLGKYQAICEAALARELLALGGVD